MLSPTLDFLIHSLQGGAQEDSDSSTGSKEEETSADTLVVKEQTHIQEGLGAKEEGRTPGMPRWTGPPE